MTQQQPFDVRFDWGEQGIAALAEGSDCVIVVDVLRFSTAVEVAAARGAVIYPVEGGAQAAQDLADIIDGVIAGQPADSSGTVFSLSPVSLASIPPETRLVLPSFNGSVLSLRGGAAPLIAGCLRNASAVARAAASYGPRVAVIAAGERWPDGSLRPSIEDLYGAGAIIAHLPGERSPEAETAADAFRGALPDLATRIRRSVSGRELMERGLSDDVVMASQHDVSVVVPLLRDGAYSARSR